MPLAKAKIKTCSASTSLFLLVYFQNDKLPRASLALYCTRENTLYVAEQLQKPPPALIEFACFFLLSHITRQQHAPKNAIKNIFCIFECSTRILRLLPVFFFSDTCHQDLIGIYSQKSKTLKQSNSLGSNFDPDENSMDDCHILCAIHCYILRSVATLMYTVQSLDCNFESRRIKKDHLLGSNGIVGRGKKKLVHP